MVNQVGWVPESLHRRAVGLLRGWVIALAIVVLIGVLVGVLTLGTLMFRWIFQVSPFPVVVSSPSDCRLGGDAQNPRLYVAVDVRMIISGALTEASSLGPSGWEVEAAGVLHSMPALDSLGDAELTRLVERLDEDSVMLSEERPSGVVVAVLDTGGASNGSLAGLRTEWVVGEPVYAQDLPLGIEFTPTGCTVTRAR
ncbi:hypothetical protein ACI2IP_10485 [Microbacterium sp. NPDC090218]